MRITLTREIAFAAGRDAGNRHMTKAGRTKWNREDYNAAATETNKLLDVVDPEQKRMREQWEKEHSDDNQTEIRR